ncbi:LruC domain-containing protein, partial [Escherichia coli]|nr:LruC domain-containing protein [Escherichia coli]
IQFDRLTTAKITKASVPNGVFANNGYFESANEIESNPSAAVLPLFDDAHRIMGNVDKRVPVNTFNNANDYGIRTLQYEVEFNSPVSSDDMHMFYLNFFIVNGGNGQNRSEVHLAGYKPTDRVKAETNNYVANDPDNSDKTMWGFIIPMSDFKYASEVVSIDQAYPAFKEWSASSGTSQKNWYMNPEEKYVYHKPVKK